MTVAQVVAPIFAAIFLGIFAKRKQLVSEEGVKGMQQFVMNFGLPCVVFNSLLTAQLGTEALTSMGLVLPLMLLELSGPSGQGKNSSLTTISRSCLLPRKPACWAFRCL